MTTIHPTTARSIRNHTPGWRARGQVLSRIGAALFGGYFLAHGMTAFLTLVLPMGKVDRVVFASLLSFAVWCAAAIHVFAARSAWRAWAWPVLAGAVLLGVALAFPEQAARP
jgi:hypothetical protein